MDPLGHGDRRHLGTQVPGVVGGGVLLPWGSPAALGLVPRVIQLTCAWGQRGILPSAQAGSAQRGTLTAPRVSHGSGLSFSSYFPGAFVLLL